jgi:hypothetical protein
MHRAVWCKFNDISEFFSASNITVMTGLVAVMMEAVSTCETSVNFNQTTRCKNTEGVHEHGHHCKKLKFHLVFFSA